LLKNIGEIEEFGIFVTTIPRGLKYSFRKDRSDRFY